MTAALAQKATPEGFCIELARVQQFSKMYPPGNPNVVAAIARTAALIAAHGRPIRFSRIGQELFVEDTVLANPSKQVIKLFDSFSEKRWESVRFMPDIGADGLTRVLERIAGDQPGAYACKGFAAGNFSIGDGGGNSDLSKEGAGYLVMVPMVQELMEEVTSGKRGAWLRAHDIVRTLTDYMESGSDLFGEVSNLKDYDEYTFTHAINVALVASSMAKSIHVADRIVDSIVLGGLCHDLGKSSIPHDVLSKPEKLSAEERAMMDRHPVEGAAIILSTPGGTPPLVPIIAFQHHMRPNGGGYPALPVQTVPHPASLLVSVADTFDALRTVRPYQLEPRTQAQSISILIDLADAGVHHKLFVSVLARIIGVVCQGRTLKLADGRFARVLAEGEFDVLTPLVETEDMEIMDLSMPGTPQIKEVLD